MDELVSQSPDGPGLFKTEHGSLLRPLRQPVFDSEWLKTGDREMLYFQRQLSQRFKHTDACGDEKTDSDTNMYVSQQLAMPLEFSLFAFAVCIPEDTSPEDRSATVDYGVLNFFFAGNRLFWSIPMALLPQRQPKSTLRHSVEDGKDKWEPVPPEKAIPYDTVGGLYESEIAAFRKDLEANQNLVTVGNSALRIRSGESFFVKLAWGRPLKLSRPVYVRVAMTGILWTVF